MLDSQQTKTVALAGIIGPLLFTSLVIVQGVLQPGYSQVRMPISALAAWPTGWIQNLNFFIVGTLMIVFALGLHSGVQPARAGRAGIVLLAVGAIGIVLAGIFPWKMVDGVPTEPASHVVAAITTFAASGLGLVVFSRRMATDPDWRDLSSYTMWTGLVVLLLFVTVGFFAIDDGAPFHAWAGLLQRVLCLIWFTCLLTLAVRLRVG